MIAKVLIFVLLFSAFNLYAQKTSPKTTTQNSADQNPQVSDEILKHLSAAETYQIAGDLINAAVENRAIAGIALQRLGNIAIEEGQLQDALKILTESKSYRDDARIKVDLAVTYLQMNETDKALEEVRAAVAADPKNIYARYILGNIYFNNENYGSALPELEKVLQAAPNFEVAQALGLTYLHLKQPERARLLFEEIQISAGKESADLHILFARNYEKTNYPAEAERELKKALAINPKKPRANFFLGYLILQNGGSERMAEAGTAFEAELKLNPNDFYANFFTGVVASSENDHQKAVKYLQKAIELNPRSGEAFLFLAQSQMELNDLPAAEKNLRQAVALEANDKKRIQARRTHYLLGRLLLRTGRREEGQKELALAEQLQREALASSRDEISRILGQVVEETKDQATGAETAEKTNRPQNLTPEKSAELKKIKDFLHNILAQAFHNLGVIAVQNGQSSEALENFATASKWKAEFPGLDRNWGIVSFRAGQFEKAVAPLARHLKSNPNDILIRQMLGTSYYFTEDFAKSVETLKPIATSLPASAELTYFFGISLVHLKRNQEAVPVFNKLAEVSQKNPEALFYAAQGFMILGDYEKAVREFRTVVSVAPKTAKANYFIGQCLIRLNRYNEAETHFSRELELNPSDVLSKYHLALTLIERKIEPEKTVTLLEEAISLKYDYADARYQLGKIYLEKGEVQKAIEQLETAVTAEPNKDFIHYQLSIAYRRASRKEDADRELKRYQELKALNRKTDAPMGNNESEPE